MESSKEDRRDPKTPDRFISQASKIKERYYLSSIENLVQSLTGRPIIPHFMMSSLMN